MLSKTGCCVLHYSSARNLINHGWDNQVHTAGGRSAQPGFLSAAPHLFTCLLWIHDKEGTSIEQLLWCRRNPAGVSNSHCYVISCQRGLVKRLGCWWAQHGNLTSIIFLSESLVVVCRTLLPLIHACLCKTNQ